MKWQQWVIGIVGSLLVTGIAAVVDRTARLEARAQEAETRVHIIEQGVSVHDQRLEELRKRESFLERLDERVGELRRVMDRIEKKIDEDDRRRRGGSR